MALAMSGHVPMALLHELTVATTDESERRPRAHSIP